MARTLDLLKAQLGEIGVGAQMELLVLKTETQEIIKGTPTVITLPAGASRLLLKSMRVTANNGANYVAIGELSFYALVPGIARSDDTWKCLGYPSQAPRTTWSLTQDLNSLNKDTAYGIIQTPDGFQMPPFESKPEIGAGRGYHTTAAKRRYRTGA